MINRRSFLSAVAAGGAAVTLPGCANMTMKATSDMPFFDGIDRRIGIQAYTLGEEIAADIPAAFARIAAIGYREVQLPNLYGKAPATLAKAAKDSGLSITSMHLAVSTRGDAPGLSLASPVQEIVDAMGVLGAKRAVMPISLFPADMKPREGEEPRAMISRAIREAGPDLWKKTAALLNEKAAMLKPKGILLGYHNHNMEFAPLGDTTGWNILMDETEAGLVEFELDVGWVAAAGVNPLEVLAELAGRVTQLHVKDIKASSNADFALNMAPAEVGAGSLDWTKILPAAEKAGVLHYYVEQEPPFTIPRFEAIKRSYQYLSALKI